MRWCLIDYDDRSAPRDTLPADHPTLTSVPVTAHIPATLRRA